MIDARVSEASLVHRAVELEAIERRSALRVALELPESSEEIVCIGGGGTTRVHDLLHHAADAEAPIVGIRGHHQLAIGYCERSACEELGGGARLVPAREVDVTAAHEAGAGGLLAAHRPERCS